jgi:hypothetical protein
MLPKQLNRYSSSNTVYQPAAAYRSAGRSCVEILLAVPGELLLAFMALRGLLQLLLLH